MAFIIYLDVDAEEAAGKVSHLPDGKRTIYTPYSYSKIERGYRCVVKKGHPTTEL